MREQLVDYSLNGHFLFLSLCSFSLIASLCLRSVHLFDPYLNLSLHHLIQFGVLLFHVVYEVFLRNRV